MSRVLHGMPLSSLPDAGTVKDDDQMVAYRSEDGQAYRTSVSDLIMGDYLDKVYPVGSIYMSINANNPADLFGGEWTQIQNRFLLAQGDYPAGTEGGSSAVTLSTANLPSHTHSMPSHTHSIPSLSGTAASAGSHTHSLYRYSANIDWNTSSSNYSLGASGWNNGQSSTSIISAGAHTHSVTTNSSTTGSTSGTSGSTGSGSAFDIMPPYLAVYMWQRVS